MVVNRPAPQDYMWISETVYTTTRRAHVLRHTSNSPRPMSQQISSLFLQQFVEFLPTYNANGEIEVWRNTLLRSYTMVKGRWGSSIGILSKLFILLFMLLVNMLLESCIWFKTGWKLLVSHITQNGCRVRTHSYWVHFWATHYWRRLLGMDSDNLQEIIRYGLG